MDELIGRASPALRVDVGLWADFCECAVVALGFAGVADLSAMENEQVRK